MTIEEEAQLRLLLNETNEVLANIVKGQGMLVEIVESLQKRLNNLEDRL